MIAKRPTTEVRSGLDQRGNRKVAAERSRSIPLLKCLVLFLLVLNLCLLSAIFVSPRGVRGYRAQQAEVLRLAALTKRLAQDNQRLVEPHPASEKRPGRPGTHGETRTWLGP